MSTRVLEADTACGRSWLEKYAHPPGVMLDGYSGIPDRTATASVHQEHFLTNEYFIDSVNTVTPLDPYTKVLWLLPPSLTKQAFGFRISAAGIIESGATRVINFPAYTPEVQKITPERFGQNCESYRMSYRSTTITQDSTANNNNTYLAAAQIRPNIMEFSLSSVEAISDHKGITRPGLRHFKEKYSAHVGFEEVIKSFYPKSEPKQEFNRKTMDGYEVVDSEKHSASKLREGTFINYVQIISLGIIPTTLGAVQMIDKDKSYMAPAKDGAFLVHRFSENSQRYISISRDYTDIFDPTSPSGTTTNCRSRCYFEYQIGTTWYLQYFYSVVGGNQTFDLPWYDMTWGMVLHDYTAAIPQPGATTVAYPIAPLMMKTIYGFEFQPTRGSLFEADVRPQPIFDDKALTTGARISQKMPDALPADANFWGAALANVIKFAPQIISLVSDVFSKKTKRKSKPLSQ